MEHSAIVELIRTTVTGILGHGRFEMREDLTALDVEGWDSLTHMSIISALEAAFNIKFKLREINKLRNMGSLIELIESKLA